MQQPGRLNRVPAPHQHRVHCRAAAAAPTQTSTLALREWAVVNAAIRDGLQTVLLRKGGIEEKGFQLEAPEFLLFPSYFHADPGLLKPGMAERYKEAMALDPKGAPSLVLDTLVRVTGAWASLDPAVVSAVEDMHVGTASFLENRTKWRRGQPLTILEVQAIKLQQPVVVVPEAKHFGCFSWVPLDLVSVCREGATPCAADFPARQKQLRERLALLSDTRELPQGG